MKKALVIFSGGQDSTTCLFWALNKFGEGNVEAITFYYGQKHDSELVSAKKICEEFNVKQKFVDISFFADLINSALTSNGDVNATNEKSLPASFVPNRNQLFITIAHGYAQKIKASALVLGVCQTDYSGYPDCRKQFIDEIQHATNMGSQSEIEILTPLMFLTKGETFYLAKRLGRLKEILFMSHTCYNGVRSKEDLHPWGYGCGKCPACQLRKKGWDEYVSTYTQSEKV